MLGVGVLLLLSGVVAGPASAQPLPEGDTGIAAAYANDEGIASDPAVVFHEDYESISGDQLSYDNSSWDNIYGTSLIVQEASKVHGGTRALEITGQENQNIGAAKEIAPVDVLFVRYYMKFHPQFPGVHHTGLGVYAFGPGYQLNNVTGVKPDGQSHFLSCLDNLGPDLVGESQSGGSPGYLYIYCYHPEQGTQWGDHFYPTGEVMNNDPIDFGDDFVPRPNFLPELDRWYSYELMTKANTPGQRDGRIAIWVDGELIADFGNLRLRDVSELKMSLIDVSVWVSSTTGGHPNQTIWYDDLVAATSYIGPMVTDAVVPPADGGDPPAAVDGGPPATDDGGGPPTAGDAGGAGAGDAQPSDRQNLGGGCQVAGAGLTAWCASLIAVFLVALVGRCRKKRSLSG